MPKGGGQEELPHVQGQGRQPRVPGCDGAGTAERSYPASEVRGRSQECQATTVQEWPRGATPHPRPEAVPERSHPTSEVRGGGERSHLAPKARGSGREEQPHARGQGQWPGGATPRPRSSGCLDAGGPRGAIPH